LLEIYHPQLSIAGAKPIKDKEPKVTAFVREILQKITDKKLTPELFMPPAGDELLSHSKEAADEFRSLGALNNIELLDREVLENGSRLYYYRLTYNSTKLVFIIGLTKDNKIDEIDLRRY
jgi:hypothetical protein